MMPAHDPFATLVDMYYASGMDLEGFRNVMVEGFKADPEIIDPLINKIFEGLKEV